MSLLSVIIPVFNRERYVREALKSVLGQTRAAEEIVVVDDGSTDGSAEAARSFGGIVQVISQANQGPAAARNAGLAASRGNLIAFLDSDDLWERRKLELQCAELEARPELDLVFCRMAPFLSEEIRAGELPAFDPSEMDARMASGLLARRSAFERTGTFDVKLRGAEFVNWLSRARKAELREAVLPEILVRRRIHHGNLMREPAARQSFVRMLKRRLDQGRSAPA